jgi:intein/homing endonuclease
VFEYVDIDDITLVGEDDVWDISLTGDEDFYEMEQNFIAQNIVVHNSHAAGIILSPLPLSKIAPLCITQGSEDHQDTTIATQFAMSDIESLGLIKFDVLGLSTKTAISETMKLIEANYGHEIIATLDLSNLPLNDKATLDLLNSGFTDGCFQLENPGMKDTLKKIHMDSFDDLVVAISMYRPGPKDYIPDYADRKKGVQTVSYAHPLMKNIAQKTYGILCYQEDTRVSLSDGTEKPIKQIRIGDELCSIDLINKRIVKQKCHGCGPTQFGEGLKITLENGFSLTVTEDHEILCFHGMKKAKDLKLDDLIACPINMPCNVIENSIEEEWLGSQESVAYLLGLLTGDGNIGSGCTIACGSKSVMLKIKRWLLKEMPALKLHSYQHCRCWHIGISCGDLIDFRSLHRGNRKTKFHYMLDKFGMKKNCYNKRIPDEIYKSRESVKMAYLAGLIDSDGCLFATSRGQAGCHYTSVNYSLLEDLRHLLQTLGVSHQIRKNRIHIWDTDFIKTRISKYLIVKKVVGRTSRGEHTSYVPSIRLRKQVTGSIRRFSEETGISRSSFRTNRVFTTSHIAMRAGIELGDLRYYRVKSIDKVSNQQFYGISVENTHNLVANGIVAKNCYQEQVMKAFMELADQSASEGYKFMKGCAKKKRELIDSSKEKFVKGALKKGLSQNVINKIWGDLEKFGGYAFNQAHATSYAYEAFKTAYLKAHFTIEFIAARLSVELIRRNFDDVDKYEQDAKKNWGISIMPVHFNQSKIQYTIVGENKLQKPLLMKGVGEKAAEEIVRHQPYKLDSTGCDLWDFTVKVGSEVNTKVMEAMWDAGMWKGITKEKLIKSFEAIKNDKKRNKNRPMEDL